MSSILNVIEVIIDIKLRLDKKKDSMSSIVLSRKEWAALNECYITQHEEDQPRVLFSRAIECISSQREMD